MHENEQRLARLERQNRNLRRWLVALTVVFGFAVFAGAAAQRNAVFDTLTVDTLFVKQVNVTERSGRGAPAVLIYARDGNPAILFNDGQHNRLFMSVYRGSPTVSLLDRDGTQRINLTEQDGEAGIRLDGPTGTTGGMMLTYYQKSQLGLLSFGDTRGLSRVQIGVSKDRVIHNVK